MVIGWILVMTAITLGHRKLSAIEAATQDSETTESTASSEV